MRFLSCLLAGQILSAATLTIDPPVIFDCKDGLGAATLAWSGASGPVQVRMLQASGPQLTGFGGPSGTASPGQWVTHGMKFLLVNRAGTEEASAVARAICGGTTRTIDPGLTSGSYFPLQVGNTWIYRNNSRMITGDYVVRSITGTELVDGRTYYVLNEGSNVIAKLPATIMA